MGAGVTGCAPKNLDRLSLAFSGSFSSLKVEGVGIIFKAASNFDAFYCEKDPLQHLQPLASLWSKNTMLGSCFLCNRTWTLRSSIEDIFCCMRSQALNSSSLNASACSC